MPFSGGHWKIGRLEDWNIGILENWKIGRLEDWFLKISKLNSTIFQLIVVTIYGSALQMPLSERFHSILPSLCPLCLCGKTSSLLS